MRIYVQDTFEPALKKYAWRAVETINLNVVLSAVISCDFNFYIHIECNHYQLDFLRSNHYCNRPINSLMICTDSYL